jgi:hypothetical protein
MKVKERQIETDRQRGAEDCVGPEEPVVGWKWRGGQWIVESASVVSRRK